MSCAATCASPSERRRSRLRLAWALGLGLPVLAAGCVAALLLSEPRPGFDHAAHLERDLVCADCHEGADSEAAAAMPDPDDVCASCHDPEIDTPEITAQVALYTERAIEERYVRPVSFEDVRFDHGAHAEAAIECATCHTGAESGPVASPEGPPSMFECMDCHAEKGASTDCETCHETMSRDVPPPTHIGLGWLRTHGPVSRVPNRDCVLERCDLCHARSDCDTCHAMDAPQDHTESWRIVTHGLAASVDRSRCTVCHQSDSCERCHQLEPPRSHRAGYGSPGSNHCLTCHEPVSSAGCTACHEGTPSHLLLAPAKPAWHNAGMNCRQCHAPGQAEAIPHPDNGGNCNACHP